MGRPKASVVNKDLAIRQLPEHILSVVNSMIKSGRPYAEIARFIKTQGELEDMNMVAVKKAIQRYKDNNIAVLLPDPVLVVAGSEDALSQLEDILPAKKPETYIDQMFKGIERDVNELAIMVELVYAQQERVKRFLLQEKDLLPMESTSKEMDRLLRYVMETMNVKQQLGIMPRVPQHIRIDQNRLEFKADMGTEDVAKLILDRLIEHGTSPEAETFRATKSRLRSGLIIDAEND